MSLSAAELAHARHQLEQALSGLRDELESHRTHHTDGGVHIRTHRDETDDDAVVEALNQQDIHAVQRGSHALAEVQAALARLSAGTYGQCTDCGEPVAPQRLAVQPAARRCLACEQAHG